MQFTHQHRDYCERLVLIGSGGLGPDLSPVVTDAVGTRRRALRRPSSHRQPALNLGNKLGSWLRSAGIEARRGPARCGTRNCRCRMRGPARDSCGPCAQSWMTAVRPLARSTSFMSPLDSHGLLISGRSGPDLSFRRARLSRPRCPPGQSPRGARGHWALPPCGSAGGRGGHPGRLHHLNGTPTGHQLSAPGHVVPDQRLRSHCPNRRRGRRRHPR